MKNPGLHVSPDCTVNLVDVPVPEPAKDELLIRVRATGVCGSDLTLWKKGGFESLRNQHPYVLGHEGAGEVVAVGCEVNNFSIGDRVAIEPGMNCMKCFACMHNGENCCTTGKFSGVLHEGGTMQRWKTHPARWCHKMPPRLTYSQGALLEPLSVVMNAFQRAPFNLGASILILGAGPIGAIAAQHARASGASRILITDIDSGRLGFAAKMCPGIMTFEIKKDSSSQENAAQIKKMFSPDGDVRFFPEVAFECTGVESSIHTAVYSLRVQGMLMCIGVVKGQMTIPSFYMMFHEIDLRYSNKYRDTWPAAIAALSAGNLNLDPLVTHKFPLEKAVEAMETFADPSTGALKVHIVDED